MLSPRHQHFSAFITYSSLVPRPHLISLSYDKVESPFIIASSPGQNFLLFSFVTLSEKNRPGDEATLIIELSHNYQVEVWPADEAISCSELGIVRGPL